ncbi:hypothetical protein FRC04_006401 [Tulasnella sp. 424]|nr:hypothetical protein FRC04_006401 [Tulasnella sp. 424]
MSPATLTRRATHSRPRAGSLRSDQHIVPSPAKTNEPSKQWPPLRQSRATKTPDVTEPDSEEVEVEMALIKDQPVEESISSSTSETPQPSSLRSFEMPLARIVGWPVRLLLACWAFFIVAYAMQETYRWASTPFIPNIPLRYTAWVVSSSAERLYPVAQPLLRIAPVVKSEIQPNTLGLVTSMDSLKRGRPQPEALQSLEKYILASMFFQDEVIKISTRVEADVDNTKRDASFIPETLIQLSSARKLILRLLPHRQEASLPRNFEAEQQLVEILRRLCTDKLPSELQYLNVRLFELSQNWAQVNGALEGLRHSATALSSQDAAWARVAGTVTGLHGRMHEVDSELGKAKSAVEHWQRDLALFKDPKDVPPNYVVSNSTLGRLVDRMNASLDQLNELRQRP